MTGGAAGPDLDSRVKLHVYQTAASSGRPPTVAQIASALREPELRIRDALVSLAGGRLLVLGRDSGEIVMAPPFSAVPTPFRVRSEGRDYFANCIWDGFGIAAALGQDAAIETSCGCCGDPMYLEVRDGAPAPARGVAHFGLPAAVWWEDITFT